MLCPSCGEDKTLEPGKIFSCKNLPNHCGIIDNVDNILAARGSTHGDFTVNARIAQRLKSVVQAEMKWVSLKEYQQEAIHMILHKIARAVAGNADFKDHWDDIAGYAKLVADRCPA